ESRFSMNSPQATMSGISIWRAGADGIDDWARRVIGGNAIANIGCPPPGWQGVCETEPCLFRGSGIPSGSTDGPFNKVPSPLVGEGQGEGLARQRAAILGDGWVRNRKIFSAPAGAKPLTLPLSHKGRGDSVETPCAIPERSASSEET